MFTLIVLVCFLPTSVLAQPDDHASVDIVRPRSISSEEYNARIRNFWTPEKLKQAKSVDIVLRNVSSRSAPSNINLTNGPQISFSGSLPPTNSTLGKAISTYGRQVYTTGRVFWRVGSTSYTCSAAVIPSNTGDLISTAGHCVYDTSKRTWFINNNWVFVPAYSAGAAPYGVWPARRMTVRTPWILSSDFNADMAFVAVTTFNGRHIQSVVGSQGIGFNFPRGAFTYSFGYPVNILNGLYLQKCSGYTQNSRWTQNNYIGQGLPCNMGGGCSGGPWLQNVVDATGIGYVTSVNSFGITNVPNVINGPYFESNIAALYSFAKGM